MSFAEFAEREHPRLVGLLSFYLRDAAVAEELAIDALVKAQERWKRVSQMEHPSAWVHRVGINLAKSHVRRLFAERRALRRALAGAEVGHVDPPVADIVATRRAVQKLTPRLKEVIVHRYFLDLSVRETARRLGITEGTVKSATYRAVAALREELGVSIEVEESDHVR